MGRLTRILLIMIAATVFAPALFAQNAVVLGTVYNSKGQTMPGVSILLENPSTGFARVATTGADGSYTIPEVPPADGYVITANTQDGLELDKRTGIAVNVGDERSILPPLREPAAQVAGADTGTATTTTTTSTAASGPAPVKASLPPTRNLIVRNETTVTSLGGVITGDQLRSLPLYNRNFLVLGLLTSNTHDVEAGSGLTGASFSISGQRPSSNSFLLDGADNIASSSNQALPFQVNDAIQEFRVTSSTANAEYGRGAGGVVSVVTRRGTNDLHGSVFGYFANDVLNSDNPLSVYKGSGFDRAASYAGPTNAAALAIPSGQGAAPVTYNQYVATALANGYCTNSLTTAFASSAAAASCVANGQGRNDFFNPAAILAQRDNYKQPFDSKQFGANVGGAIIKNKLFAFTSYEATRIDNPTPIFERVPSAFDRQLHGSATDPNYAIASRVLALYPQANVVAVPGVLEYYQGEAPNYTNVHNLLLRSDWTQSNKSNFNFRYAGQLLDQLHDDTLPTQQAYVGNGAKRRAQNQNATVTWNKTLGQSVINETRLVFSQFRVTDRPQDAGFDATSLGLPTTSLPTIQLSGIDTQYSGAAQGVAGAIGGWYDSFWNAGYDTQRAANQAPAMLPSLDGQFPFARIGAPFSAPSTRRDTTWGFADNVSWNRPGSAHSFKFGGDFRFIQNRVTQGGFARGTIVSSNIGEFTSDSATCNIALVGGNPCGQGFRAPSFDYALNQQSPFDGLFDSFNYSGYVQDKWVPFKNKRLTINVGARYEYFGVPEEVNDQIWNYDPDNNGLVQQNHSTLFDPYGYTCQPGVTVPRLDSVVRDRSFGQQQNWTCAPQGGNGKMVKSDLGNFSGRFGFAYDIRGGHPGETVVRGGVGIFYDQLPVSYMSQLLYNRPTQLNLANPRYVYGQNFLGTFVPGDPSNGTPAQATAGTPCQQCGFGNSTVNPANLQQFYQSAASPFVLYARDFRNSRTPYTRQANLTVQQQVTDRMVVEAGYVGSASRRLPIVVNRGFNNEWFCTNSTVPVTVSGAPPGSQAPVCDTFSYFPVFTMSNQAEANYHSLMVKTRISQFHGMRLNATYSWAKSLDNASSGNFPLVPTPLFTQAFGLQFFGLGNPFGFSLGQGGTVLGKSAGQIGQTGTIAQTDTFSSSVTTTGAGAVIVSRYNLPQDPQNALVDEYGRSDFDTQHRFVMDFNYDLPFAKDSKWLGGWQLAGILAAQSGQPFTIFSGPVFGELTQRVNASDVQMTGNPDAWIAGNLSLPAKVGPGGSPATSCGYATGAVLYQGAIGRPCTGTSGRNSYTGPAYVSLDMAIQKGFKVWGEGKELTFRTEVFNLFNRANYYNPISVVSLDGFNFNPDFGQVKSAQNPRQLQFAVRFSF
jgi:hypothetical protein